MIVYGKNPILELLRSSPQRIEKILIAKKTHLPKELYQLIQDCSAPVIHVEKRKLDKLSGRKQHQGIIAIIRDIEFWDPHELIKDLINNKEVLLIINHVEDPQNLGNIIRSAEVFGVHGVIIPALRSAGITETVIRASQGAIFHLKLSVVKNILNFIRLIKEEGIWIYSLERGGSDINNVTFNFPLALVIGSEGKGISPSILKDSHEIVSIPMFGKVNSLNVASATAIALFKIRNARECLTN